MNKNNLKLTFLTLLLLPILFSLGLWQLDRAEQKKAIQGVFEQRRTAAALPIQRYNHETDLRFRQVSLRGRYLSNNNILLDNRIHQGQFGYEVVTPFLLADESQLVLVNRGWLKGDVSRRTLPVVETAADEVQLTGQIYVAQGKMLQLAEPEKNLHWPKVLQTLNPAELAESFDEQLFPAEVRLRLGSPGALQPNWVVVNVSPEKHIGYAVQWFAMAAVLLLIYVATVTGLATKLKRRAR